MLGGRRSTPCTRNNYSAHGMLPASRNGNKKHEIERRPLSEMETTVPIWTSRRQEGGDWERLGSRLPEGSNIIINRAVIMSRDAHYLSPRSAPTYSYKRHRAKNKHVSTKHQPPYLHRPAVLCIRGCLKTVQLSKKRPDKRRHAKLCSVRYDMTRSLITWAKKTDAE